MIRDALHVAYYMLQSPLIQFLIVVGVLVLVGVCAVRVHDRKRL